MSKIIQPYRIFLMAMMGGGKTTVGKALAESLGWPFFDNDVHLKHLTNKSNLELEKMSVDHLHEWEVRTALDFGQKQAPLIASLAGYLGERADVLSELGKKGHIIYLKAKVETLIERIKNNPPRPLLNQSDNPEQLLAQLLGRRSKIYENRACFIITVDDLSVEKIVEKIINHLIENANYCCYSCEELRKIIKKLEAENALLKKG